MDKEYIPRSCEECIKSKYKRPLPDCAHEQGIAHKKTYKFFKEKYGVEIPQHLEEMKRCKQQREQCLQQIQQQAREMVSLRQGLGIDQLLNNLTKLNDRVNDLEDSALNIDGNTHDRILASPDKDRDEETTTKTIIAKKKKKKPEKKDKNLSMAERGWLTYIRNCKKENVKKYVKELKDKHPDITDNQIDIGINGAGNRMIRYTLNPDLAHE